MGEIHINLWRENIEEGMDVTFEEQGICKQNGKHRFELAFRTKSGAVISFWTCDPLALEMLLAQAIGTIVDSRNHK